MDLAAVAIVADEREQRQAFFPVSLPALAGCFVGDRPSARMR